MTLHVFDEGITLSPVECGWRGHTHPAWWNMVGPFGGMTAATVIKAIFLHPQCMGSPSALTVNYLAPVTEGAFTVALRIARTNRSSQHWVIEITQEQPDGTTASVLTGTAVTAVRRPTFNATDAHAPAVPSPSQLDRAAPPPELEWLSRYDVRWLSGEHPNNWDGRESAAPGGVASQSQLWARLVEPRTMDYAALAAVADVFYPRVWLRRASRVPAGTVSMTVYFHADAQDLIDTGDGFVLCQARAHAFRDGHADQTAHIWNEAGTLLATTHQLVYYKA